MAYRFPLSYRWFIARNLTNFEPWFFTELGAPLLGEGQRSIGAINLERQFKLETQATFDVYLFAKRQDRDDFAFFVLEGGDILDKVVTIHLSFSQTMELKAPLVIGDVTRSFANWISDVVVPDVEDWMSEEDLLPVDVPPNTSLERTREG
jgi:hypothetical protein